MTVMARQHLHRGLAAMVAAGLVMGGCTSEEEPQPETTLLPIPTATATPTPSPTQAVLDPDAVAQAATNAVVDVFNLIYGMAVDATEVPADVTAAIAEVSAPDSDARTYLEGQATIAVAPEVVLRGDVVGVPLAPAEIAGDGSFTVPACLSTLTENAIEDPPEIGIATEDGLYLAHPLEGTLDDNGEVVLTRVVVLPDQDNPLELDEDAILQPCVPDDVASGFQESWQAYVDAEVAYSRDTSSVEAREELALWVAPDSDALAEYPYTVELADVLVDPVIEEARRGSLRVTSCQDPSRNPQAVITAADGEEQPLPQIVAESQWEPVDGRWRRFAISSFTEARADSVPELWERCFGN